MVLASNAPTGVAIIGVACRFPGARNLEAFWSLLREGRDAIGEIPAARWRDGGGDALPRWAGLLEDVAGFDAEFFRISPREARQMDPQQRLLLEETWHCLEDAGVAPEELRRAPTAVFAGLMATDYRQRLAAAGEAAESFSYLGNAGALLANRISHCFGLRGESKAVDAACASSLVALHDARRVLVGGEADYAIVAAANVLGHPWKHASFHRAHMLSPTGRCRTFSAAADGYVPGEGVAVLLLQRWADARRAGRRIYGGVAGSAVNHCGASLTVTSPSIPAQRDVIRAALASAGLPAAAISYVEAHGTGTARGDPMELEALRQALAGGPDAGAARPRCVVGSVKTNIGHLEAAAGLAGVIKVLLMLRERTIPPSLHGEPPNPIIDFARSPFAPAAALQAWPAPADGAPRRAGVSSFGFGGANAHVIIEEVAAGSAAPPSPDADGARPFLLSARSEAGLRALVAAWREYAAGDDFASAPLAAVAATLARGRDSGPWRTGGVVRSHADVRRLLAAMVPRRADAALRPGFIFGDTAISRPAVDSWLAIDARLAELFRSNAEAVRSLPEGTADGAAAFCLGSAVGARLAGLGVEPGWVVGAGSGRGLALVCAGRAGIADAWRLQCGGAAALPLARPRCRCQLCDEAPVVPVEVTAAMLDSWRRSAVADEVALAAFATARALLESQPTFARFMQEWAPQFGDAGPAERLAAVLAGGANPTNAEALQLFVIVQSCRRRLSRKWELPEVAIAEPGAGVLTELVAEGLLPMADFGALFQADADLGAQAAALQGRLATAPGRVVERLAALIPDGPRAAGPAQGAAVPEGLAVAWGAIPGLPAEPLRIDRRDARTPGEAWLDVLVALWERGVPVNWTEWAGGAPFTPLPLPAYPFERKTFWVDLPPSSPAPAAVGPAPAPGRIHLRPPASAEGGPPPRGAAPAGVRTAPAAAAVAAADALLPWELREGVAFLRLAEQTGHNCLSDPLIAAFATRLAQVAADATIRALVIGNEGPHFCAGGTPEFIAQLRRGERTFADLGCFYRGLLECPVPVVQAVSGHAFGGGLAFALFGDVVVLAAESRYGANFLSLGFTPGMGATLIVPEKLGPDAGARLLYSGDTLSGRELAAAGARVQVVERAQVRETALGLARDFARQSRAALEELKRQLAAPLLARLAEHERRELEGHRVTLVGTDGNGEPAAKAAPPPAPPVAPAPRPADAEPPPRDLTAELQALAGKLLLMQPGEIDPAKPFRELGMDSVLTVELAKAINRRWPVALDAAVLYEHPTMERLAAHLGRLGAAPARRVVATPAPPAGRPPADPPEEGIAVIGMSGRFPGADDLEEFWRNLEGGVDSVTGVPAGRWDAAGGDGDPDRASAAWGGFLRDVDRFDPLFFRIPPAEAEAMDPQQRLFLEEAWKALEHAGHGALQAASCGVFVGVAAGDYAVHLERAGRADSAEAFLGLAPSILAARLSYLLDLRGPSVAIDTACSSSLVAVHQACQSLRQGECALALAGGVTLLTTPQLHRRAGRAGMLSPTGRCRPFGAAADGIALGEGVGVVVLKPLATARADGDTIYGVIRASGVNQDGATNGITAPNARAQEQLIRGVLGRAGVAPASLQWVEAHGTGTALGDPIELRALAAAFAGAAPQSCALGSVKSNIGHTVCAAGVAGLIKVLLALRHGMIPPSLHFGTGNPRVRLAETPFFVNDRVVPWPRGPAPRRAAVSSFGFSGTNAHVVLEEAPAPPPPADGSVGPHRLELSARTAAALARYVEAWRAFVDRPAAELPPLADAAYTLAVGRARLPERAAVWVRDYAELRAALAAFARGDRTAWTAPAAEAPSSATGRRVALPTYPFERLRCWADAPANRDGPEAELAVDDGLEALLESLARAEVSVEEAEARIAGPGLPSR